MTGLTGATGATGSIGATTAAATTATTTNDNGADMTLLLAEVKQMLEKEDAILSGAAVLNANVVGGNAVLNANVVSGDAVLDANVVGTTATTDATTVPIGAPAVSTLVDDASILHILDSAAAAAAGPEPAPVPAGIYPTAAPTLAPDIEVADSTVITDSTTTIEEGTEALIEEAQVADVVEAVDPGIPGSENAPGASAVWYVMTMGENYYRWDDTTPTSDGKFGCYSSAAPYDYRTYKVYGNAITCTFISKMPDGVTPSDLA